jgi:hypothetical protein
VTLYFVWWAVTRSFVLAVLPSPASREDIRQRIVSRADVPEENIRGAILRVILLGGILALLPIIGEFTLYNTLRHMHRREHTS